MKKNCSLVVAAVLATALPAYAEVANVKVVTDANPDYSDMESMVRSITSRWETDEQKMYALFYWDHIARRQTSPMYLHGYELTDPIRQFNDYGFMMCSTIAGAKCSVWNYMGYPCRFWEIGIHTVPDVWFDGKFHHYDNSLSAMYTLCDGKTIASVQDVGKVQGCEASGGKAELGHIAIYHCLNGTSVNGFLEGADTERTLSHLGDTSFHPKNLRYQYQYYSQERGHRYSLNLREGEVYTRFYSRQDIHSANAKEIKVHDRPYKLDPAYFVPNRGETGTGPGRDPEIANPRYRIRANGVRTWTPLLDEAHLPAVLHSSQNIRASSGGIQPAFVLAGTPGGAVPTPAEAIFKVEGGNVIASMKIRALTQTASEGERVSLSISTTNGLQWQEIWKSEKAGENAADLKLRDEVSGAYEVLLKVKFFGKEFPTLKSIAFETITQVNGKTQPQLKLGRNSVYVGVGEQTNSIVLFPDLRSYKTTIVDESNINQDSKRNQMLTQADRSKPAHVTYRIDAPTDVTAITYGARMSNRGDKNHIDFLHSFDGGKTWKQTYSNTDNNPPWDIIRYEKVTDIPAGTRSVLFKYTLNGSTSAEKIAVPGDEGYQPNACAIFSVRMEVNHQLAAPSREPLEVTFAWQERKNDYTTTKRSHKQLVEKLPFTYHINVGGDDHPIVDSLTVNLQQPLPSKVIYGYSDGKDVGGEKWVGKWATYGKNLALHKPYTVSIPSETNWEAGDPEGKKLTDGRVGSTYTGGINMREGLIWKPEAKPEIIVDLGESQRCAAFRIHTLGYEWWDGMKGNNKDQAEVLISTDGKDYKPVGKFNFHLHWVDIPVNFMYPDDETFCGYNYFLAPKAPVEARYVKYKLYSPRMMEVSEVQVLESFKFEPFDLRIALPDPSHNGKAPPKPDISPNARRWAAGERPTSIGVPIPRAR